MSLSMLDGHIPFGDFSGHSDALAAIRVLFWPFGASTNRSDWFSRHSRVRDRILAFFNPTGSWAEESGTPVFHSSSFLTIRALVFLFQFYSLDSSGAPGPDASGPGERGVFDDRLGKASRHLPFEPARPRNTMIARLRLTTSPSFSRPMRSRIRVRGIETTLSVIT